MPAELRRAIARHRTETVDRPWDADANVARIPSDAGAATLRRMFAWVDPEGDPDTKAAYKFPHHEVDADGRVGAANVRACRAGIAVLNGARGGADIPDADRQGVWNHLAGHLEDAGLEPPALRTVGDGGFEVRTVGFTAVRVVEGSDGRPAIHGHAAVFEQLSVPLWGFREKVARGAFRQTIVEDDIRALWNHDPLWVLGRTKSRTLRLAEDEVGLAVEIDPPDTQWARDALVTIRRGDVDQMSFQFQAREERWEGTVEAPIRTLVNVQLLDVSPATFPAYPQTDLQVRALTAWAGLDPATLARMLYRHHRGIPLTAGDRELVQQAIARLSDPLAGPASQGGAGPTPAEPGPQGRPRALLRRRLELILRQ